MFFTEFNFSEVINKNIKNSGFEKPTLVQKKTIPQIMLGKNVIVCAQTGTGKTASYALPIINRLIFYANSSRSPAKHLIRCLVITPTRELALQISENFIIFSKNSKLKISVIFGGVPLDKQSNELKSGFEILITTPGRFLDIAKNQNLNLTKVEHVVLDEADKMLDMGFLNDILKILSLVPKKRQTLLFSATFSSEISKLAESLLIDPVTVKISKNTISETIKHKLIILHTSKKYNRLISIIKEHSDSQILIFCNTKSKVKDLSNRLHKNNLANFSIHGDKHQSERIDVIKKIQNREIKLLIATDIASRGIHIDNLDYVINYDLPTNPENYVHRIGRTGRAGSIGQAISFASSEEQEFILNIEKLIKAKLNIVNEVGGKSITKVKNLAADYNGNDVAALFKPPL